MIKLVEELQQLSYYDKLNPKIWSSDNKLLPQVRAKINEIIDAFTDYVEIPLKIVDVHILGSNASYNYTDNSDLDVHIVTNFDMIKPDCSEILQAYYNTERTSFNNTYDIKIKGIDVEIYVEDIKANTVSNGIYSLYSDKWIKFPKKIQPVDIDLEPELSKVKAYVSNAINSSELELVEDTINSLYLIRKNSLAISGEYGKGNLIFKEIRNLGLLDKLKDKRAELISRDLSLESLRNQQIQESYGYFTLDRLNEIYRKKNNL